MPIPIRDPHSGAIVFHPTPEEQVASELVKDLKAMKEELDEKLDIVNKIIESKDSSGGE